MGDEPMNAPNMDATQRGNRFNTDGKSQ
jgi:hypothetical protein